MDKSKNLHGHLFALTANVMWGLMAPIGKSALQEFSALSVTTFRMIGAAAAFWMLSIFCKQEHVNHRDMLKIFFASLFALVFNQGIFIFGACVVAMPDERLGERSCAYVVLKAPHHSLSLEEVVAFFSRKRVAKYKYPEHIVVIEKLPRTASGKIQKFLLRKDIMRRLTQDVCEEIE